MRHGPFRKAVLAVMSLDGESVVESAATYDVKELDLRAFHVRRALQVQATLELLLTMSTRPSRRRRRLAWVLAAGHELRLAGFAVGDIGIVHSAGLRGLADESNVHTAGRVAGLHRGRLR